MKSNLAKMAKEANRPTATTPGRGPLNAKINKDVLKRMRVYCAIAEETIQDFITNAIVDALAQAEKRKNEGH
jgi:DNA-binding protein YbaB